MKYSTNDFYITKSERHGLYFMLGCMILIIATTFLVNNYTIQEVYHFEEVELMAFSEFVHENSEEKLQKQMIAEDQNSKTAFNFNPNTTPLDSLLQLPIPGYIAKRIDKYRNKGGKFNSVADLGKIYGIEPHLNKISQYVQIPKLNAMIPSKSDKLPIDTLITSNNSGEHNKDEGVRARDTSTYTHSSGFQKTDTIFDNRSLKSFEEDENLMLELNKANQYELQLINGIGPYISKKIIEFRNEVGGFYTINQLKEIGMREENFRKVVPHLTCDPVLIRKRNINYTRQDSLAMIPGIGYKKAKIAVLYINNHFPLEGPEDLKKIKIFNDKEIELMLKYLNFKN